MTLVSPVSSGTVEKLTKAAKKRTATWRWVLRIQRSGDAIEAARRMGNMILAMTAAMKTPRREIGVVMVLLLWGKVSLAIWEHLSANPLCGRMDRTFHAHSCSCALTVKLPFCALRCILYEFILQKCVARFINLILFSLYVFF